MNCRQNTKDSRQRTNRDAVNEKTRSKLTSTIRGCRKHRSKSRTFLCFYTSNSQWQSHRKASSLLSNSARSPFPTALWSRPCVSTAISMGCRMIGNLCTLAAALLAEQERSSPKRPLLVRKDASHPAILESGRSNTLHLWLK